MVFNRNSPYPYFYKPITYHSSDKNRQKISYSVNFLDGYRPVNSTKTKRILFYKPPGWYRNSQDHCRQGLKKCPQKHCECLLGPRHIDQADVVIFDLTQLNIKEPPARKPNQVWAMFGIECPFYYGSHLYETEAWRGVFNWTMTYRLDSDIIYPYGVFYRRQPPLKANFSQIALNKTKSALWFVSNCNTPSKRQQYVKELRKYNISVDMYGNCGPLKCRGPHCDGMYNEYRFYLSFENSPCFDYFTEKLFKVYSHNIVPVVRGGANYSSLVPPGTYINAADFSTPQELAKHLQYLEQNVTAYAEILERKSRYIQTNLDQLESAYCDFCVKIHNLDLFRQQYYDIGKWLTQETCHV
ncbi:alpha-(1,3)-fucosyltransferase C-like [Haliotis asinina]|uniref:alpha-(1,3)-fucosyltransferase C-like n=1 Tax=Haliotis asinina TaxID=109174 RepID=UPI003531DA15